MTPTQLAVAVISLCAACLLAGLKPVHALPQVITTPGSKSLTVVGADGVAVPVGNYQRIVSGSTVVDHILMHVVEPERIVAVTWWGAEKLDGGFRFGAKPRLRSLESIEPIIVLRPDLVITHNYDGDLKRIARLRDAGVAVFDCGQMRGWSDLRDNLREVGQLLGQETRAAEVERDLRRRLHAIAGNIAPESKRSGMYLSIYAGRLFGGTIGSSFHDMLTFAGVIDAAAAAGYKDWPQYDIEELLALNPELIVTRTGMTAELRAIAGLERVRALRDPKGIVELSSALVEDPGFGLLPAAEAVHAAVYGDRP